MPRTQSQQKKIRDKKIEFIESVALECFAVNGYHNTSINTIAKQAGISIGLTYNYFSGKEELLKSIYLKGIKRVFEPLERYELPLSNNGICDFIERIFKEIQENYQFWKLYFMVMSQPDIFSKYEALIAESMMPAMKKISSYFKNNEYSDPESETLMLTSTLDGICLNYLLNQQTYPLEKIKQKLLMSYEQ